VDLGYNSRNELTGLTRMETWRQVWRAGRMSYTFDDAGRLTALRIRMGRGRRLSYYDYQYDNANR